jgi:hypothetical protein
MRKILLITFLIFTYSLSAQSWQWAVKDSGNSIYPPGGTAICVDSSGNSYIVGVGNGNVYFNSCGSTTYTGWIYGMIAKYDVNGNCVWVKPLGGYSIYPNPDGVYGIALDNRGNLLVTGVFWDSAYFGGIHLIGATGNNLFVAKYDNNGNVIWAKGCPCSMNEGGNGISVDRAGNVYVTGCVNGIGTLGSCGLSNGFLLTKLDSNGNCIWAIGNSNANVIGKTIKTDSIGNSYIGGTYIGKSIFGHDTLCLIQIPIPKSL